MLCLQIKSDDKYDEAIDRMLGVLLTPDDQPSIQIQALRQDIIRHLRDAIQKQELENELLQFKRSYGALARRDDLPFKRNIQSLAKAGYIRNRSDPSDQSFKRSLGDVVKDAELPSLHRELDMEEKRGLESLARNGDLRYNREIRELLDELQYKRNLGSLAREYNFPIPYGKRLSESPEEKRNVASLARSGMKINGKREVVSNPSSDLIGEENVPKEGDGKRNIASIKAQYKPTYKRSANEGQKRRKRDTDYHYDDAGDYENTPEEALEYLDTMKRFLGKYHRLITSLNLMNSLS